MNKTVIALFEEQVRRVPHDVAVICAGESLSYHELNDRANQLAHYLQERYQTDYHSPLAPDSLIALGMEPSLYMIIAILAILKAGGAYVPIDINYPAHRIEYMLQDSQAKFLLTQENLIEKLTSLSQNLKPSPICIALDSNWQTIADKSSDNLVPITNTNNLAYIIYTSGSTGNPKGVMIPHHALMHYTGWAAKHYKIDEGAGSLLHSSIAFDLTITALFTPLISGKLIYVLSAKQTLAELPNILAEKNLNLIKLTPSHLKLLQEVLTPEQLSQWGPSIVVTVIGGEMLYAEDLAFWRQQENVLFFNEYGPTEATVGCCVYAINDKSPTKGPMPIGKPIINTQLLVLNANKKPSPIGVIGELYIGGDGLALGYLNQSQMTQERFIRNPFSKDPKARLYKTGDLVRWLPDGNLMFIGRNDDQVKIRGFRIELGEIETQLRAYSKIKQCVVLAEGEKENKHLVAYVVPQEKMTLEANELDEFLKQILPEYMVPSTFILVDSIPLTAHGKIDTKALAEKEARYLTATTHYVAPRSAEEQSLVDIWAQVLKRDPLTISIHDSFFTLGGHSLLATQVVSRIRSLFQIDLSLAEFFETPNIADLMQNIHEKEIHLPTHPALGPRPENAELLLSFAQERLWFLDQFQPQHAFYNVPMAFQLKGPLNLFALESAFYQIIKRHEDLRTRFISIEGQARQDIQPKDQVTFKLEIKLFEKKSDNLDKQLKNLASKEARIPFNLSEGPLIRVKLFEIEKDNHLLLITLHHIITDAWSMSVFYQELNELYQAALENKPNRLPPLPIQYADFSYWQRQYLTGELLETQLSFWKKQLDGIVPLQLPLDYTRPAIQTYNGKTLFKKLSPQLTESIKQLSQKSNVTLFTTLLSAFVVLLSRYCGQEDIAIGTPLAGRSLVETESLIGLFLNTLVLRSDLSTQLNFLTLVQSNQHMILDTYAHQDIPFEKLVDELVVERDLSHSPLFQVMFTLENTPDVPLQLPQIETISIPAEYSSAKFDLSVGFAEDKGQLNAYLEYNTDLFKAESIERLWKHFIVLIEKLIENPEQSISAIPLLTADEQKDILIDWNKTHAEFPHKTISQLFEEQVTKNPDKIAVIFEEKNLTYAELNAKANQLTHYLREQYKNNYHEDLKPDSLIAVCVDRGLDMIVGILGILKAGAAYVPIDPQYPSQRIEYILQDSQTKFLLTQHHLMDKLPPLSSCILLDLNATTIADLSTENFTSISKANNLAYVIYTSGSTGQPKGVLIENSNLVNVLYAVKSALSISSNEILLALASFAFDISCIDFFLPLICGARFVIASSEMVLNPSELIEIIRKEKISLLQATPVTWQLLLNEGWKNDGSIKVLSTGEALPGTLAKQLIAENNSVWNLYGPTEITVWATLIKLDLSDTKYPIAPIGKPISNTQVYVLDPHLQVLPIGAVGELHIGGSGLARGYLNKTELTKEKFIKNPFSEDPKARLYKTGDLVRWLPDGNLEYIGRKDDQVKVRGFRIELGEIEAQLNAYPQLHQSVVLVKTENKNKRLIAYLVPEENSLDLADLRSFLKERLPDYMIPHGFVILESMPLTPNGKIDRNALLQKEESLLKTNAEYAAPQTEKEKILTRIWSDVLKQDPSMLSIHDNFFELGGDSILSLQIIAKARQHELQLTPQQLFSHPTIASLAKVAQKTAAHVIEQGIVIGEAALTPIQHWFFERITPDYSHFNQSFLFKIQHSINLDYVQMALMKLLVHHDALRMSYSHEKTTWKQFNRDTKEDRQKFLRFEIFDLSALTEEQQNEAMTKYNSQCNQQLELTGPLVAAYYYNLGTRQHRLSLVIHHLVIDGVSWRILTEDLENIYRQLAQENRSEKDLKLPAKTTSFKDWANQLKKYAQTDQAKTHYSYWLTQTESVMKNEAGFDRGIIVDYPERLKDWQENNKTKFFKNVFVKLSIEETRTLLQDVPPIYGTQINDVLLSALTLAFHKTFAISSLLIDLEGHGRETVLENMDISRTIAWFTSLFPIQLQLDEHAETQIDETLKSIKEQLRKIPQRGIGYGILKYLSDDPHVKKTLEDQTKSALVFNYLGQFDTKENKKQVFNITDENSGEAQPQKMVNDHLFEINGSILASQLQFSWAFSERLFNHSTVESLANTFLNYLRAIIEHCQQQTYGAFTPSDFPLIHLDLEELNRLFAEDLKDWEPKRDIQALYPLSPLQQGLLFHHLYDSKNESYFIPIHLYLTGNMNSAAFHEAWQVLVNQYDVLRTGFVGEKLTPLQFVVKKAQLPWQTLDLRALSAEKRQQQIQKILDDDLHRGFNFHQPPLMRCTLIQTADKEHLLIWSIHHIIIDGWSVAILLSKLFQHYDQLSADKSIVLTYVEPYQDFIAWLQQQDQVAAQAYWQNLLKGFTHPTQLSIRSQTKKSGQVQKIQHLSKSLTDRISAFSREHHITISSLFHGVWARLLHSYSNEEDIVFGSTVSGRSAELPDIEHMVGLLINTLPVRSRLKLDQSAYEYLDALQNELVNARQYEYAALTQIQAWSEVPTGTALFNSLFVFENYPSEKRAVIEDANRLRITKSQSFEHAHYELSCIAGLADKFFITLEYNASLYTEDTINNIFLHFITLLENIIKNPKQKITEIALLMAEEKQKILFEWNATHTPYPADKTIQELFEEQVRLTPDSIAVIDQGKCYSYRELNRKSNQLAHYLRAQYYEKYHQDLPTETLIPIAGTRSLEMIIGFLGILKAGGAYVPIDPHFPLQRIKYILDDSQAKILILTQTDFFDTFSALLDTKDPPICIQLDADWPMIADASEENLKVNINPTNLAYVIYTSGSTGNPKGVEAMHRSVIRLVKNSNYVTTNKEDRVAHLANIVFDAATFEIWGPLLNNAICIIFTREQVLNHSVLIQEIKDKKINMMFLSGSLFNQLINLDPTAFFDIEYLVIGGEILNVKAIQKLINQKYKPRFVVNGYGPTEATTFATYYVIEHLPAHTVSIPIGKPLANTTVYVLDRYLQPVPIGVMGELFVGGPGVARAYLNNPSLTAQKFIPNTFDNTSAKIYRTGDLVKWLPNGNLEFIGRSDDQVKVRGFRIELDEIVAQLKTHPQIHESAVLVKSEKDGARLIAYIEPFPDSTLDANSLREFLKDRLPDYMIPNAFILIDKMPLTPTHKLDKKALAEREIEYLKSITHYVAPQSPEEQTLANIWSEVLKLKPSSIGIHDNFFTLGGHSLLATQVISRIRSLFQVELSISALFDHPTIEGLLEQIQLQRKQHEGIPSTEPAISTKPIDSNNPLSFAQERLWFLDQLQPCHAFYNIPIALCLRGKLDLEALETAFQQLIQRQESLRTIFTKTEETPQQFIMDMDQFNFSLSQKVLAKDQSSLEQLKILASAEAQKAFNLSTGPLIRVELIHIEPEEHLLLITLHHIITDGWSMAIFSRELNLLYQSAHNHKPLDLPALPIKYIDFSYWQRHWMTGKVLKRQLDYWKKQLKNISPIQLPWDFTRPAMQTYNGKTLLAAIPQDLILKLKELSQKVQVTLFTTLLSAFAVLLYRYSGQEDIVIGSPIAGRNNIETEDLIGLFINTLALRNNLSGHPNFLELLQRTHRMTLEAYTHQDIPFEKLVEAIEVTRDPSRSPLFQVMFILQNIPANPWQLADIQINAVESDYSSAKFDMTFALSENDDGQISGYLEYNTDLFKAETIEQMWLHFLVLLNAIVTHAEQPIAQLPLLTIEEQEEISDWGSAKTKYPIDKTISQLFEEQAARTPDNIAIVFKEKSLTYRELNEKANQLAHYLRGQYQTQCHQALTPDTLIAIILDRSFDMMIGILGILKAGAAYVPIDPQYPAQRIQYTLQDSQTKLVLSESSLITDLQAVLTNLESKLTIIPLDSRWPDINKAPKENLPQIAQGRDLAYVIYTSGSTGTPKGVLIEHYNVARLFASTADFFHFTEQDIWSLFHSFAFDVSVWEMWGALFYGGRLVIVPYETSRSPEDFYNFIRREKITVLSQTPTAFKPFMNIDQEQKKKDLCLCYIIFAGEKLEYHNLIPWFEIHEDNKPKLIDMYGITETTVHSTFYSIAKEDAYGKASIIGIPLPDLSMYVLDKNQQALPVGIIGELYVGGAGLARGYLNRPELTQERFIANPLEPNTRLYKSGDLVRWLPNGNLEYIERADDQVKIRGFRIELGEIEAQLLTHPEVHQAVVLVKTENDDKRLIAFIVLNKGAQIEVLTLRDFLKQRLPDYMIPNAFVTLDEMPLTANGKIDKKALLEQSIEFLHARHKYIYPRNDVEFKLIQIWEEILNTRPIGINDNFFELGGHSLLLIPLISRIETTFHKKLPISIIFEKPTIRDLAEAIAGEETVELSPIVNIQTQGNKLPVFCVYPAMGTAFCYLLLSEYLGNDQPFYGIQDPTTGKSRTFSSIEKMASIYVEFVKKVQPEGPYNLSGWSLGGLIAYEMAQQMIANGDEIENLILIDSVTGEQYKSMDEVDPKKLKQDLIEDQIIPPMPKTYSSEQWIDQMVAEITQRTVLMWKYKPKTYLGKRIVLIKASESRGESDILTPSKDNGWLVHAPNLEVYYALGNHGNMLSEPHVHELAELIKQILTFTL